MADLPALELDQTLVMGGNPTLLIAVHESGAFGVLEGAFATSKQANIKILAVSYAQGAISLDERARKELAVGLVNELLQFVLCHGIRLCFVLFISENEKNVAD
jgi:hypothetical protein